LGRGDGARGVGLDSRCDADDIDPEAARGSGDERESCERHEVRAGKSGDGTAAAAADRSYEAQLAESVNCATPDENNQ
jgi:hypothetical protein